MGNGPSAYAVATGTGDGDQAPSDPVTPETIYYNPQQRLQRVQDTYDGTLQQSRFQFQSPIHF
jgi:hypothetical protein